MFAFLFIPCYLCIRITKEHLLKQSTMALTIKSIPPVTGKDAERFIQAAEKAEKNRASIDFTEQIKITHAILEKSRKRGY